MRNFGFKNRYKNCYEYIREIEGKTAYRIYTTLRHQYIQIEIFEPSKIAGSIQSLLYDLIKADMVVKE